jgi:agmatinase
MTYLDLYASQTNIFSGVQRTFEEAEFIVFGVPFDSTSTYRTGARFGPNAIRQASQNIETYSFRSGMDIENLLLHDAGDLPVSTDVLKTIDDARLVVKDILAADKMPVALGGEHTITLGIAKALSAKASQTAAVSFDAHLDLRPEFLGSTLSHTTFMQIVSEKVKPGKIFEVGTRSACKEELAFAKKAGVEFFTSQQIIRSGSELIAEQLKEKLSQFEYLNLTVDMMSWIQHLPPQFNILNQKESQQSLCLISSVPYATSVLLVLTWWKLRPSTTRVCQLQWLRK